MSTPNFGAILDKPAADIERPKPLPFGTYLWIIKGQPRFDKSSKRQTEFVEFSCQPQAAEEDVDEDSLTEWSQKKDGTSRRLADITQKLTFYLKEDIMWRLKKFLVDDLQIEELLDPCKPPTAENKKSTRQMLDETANATFRGQIKHRSSDDGGIFPEFGTTSPAE